MATKPNRPTKVKTYTVLRGGRWYYRRRVPAKFAAFDTRAFVTVATECDASERAAAEKVAHEINAATEKLWRDMAAGAAPSTADQAYAAAVSRARDLGFTYRTAADLAATASLDEIAARVGALIDSGQLSSAPAVDAVLGAVTPPQMLLSQLPERYFALTPDKQRDKRADTTRNWKNRRRRAVEMLIDFDADKPVSDIRRPDMLAFRSHLIDLVDAGEITAPYANKCLSYIAAMVRTYGDMEQVDVPNVFDGLRLEGAEDRQRPPFDRAYVRDVLLGSDALAGCNEELRALFCVVVSTGLRPIEFVRMAPERIVLDAPIPYLDVRAADGTKKAAATAGLKTRHTGRRVPLFGSALAAVKRFPEGLKRYRDNNHGATSALGKFLRENGLLPTPAHSLYSCRHTYKDALLAARTPDDMVDYLMGHKTKKPSYGEGYPLDVLTEYVSKAAFDAPPWI